jgi:hypothetical protein
VNRNPPVADSCRPSDRAVMVTGSDTPASEAKVPAASVIGVSAG